MAEKKQLISTEKLNLLKNRKVLLGLTALLILMVVIFLFSFVPYTISGSRLREPSFITDLLMVCVITIFALVGMLFVGQASNAQNPKSKIAKATVEFIVSKQKVVEQGQTKFKQWIVNVLRPKDKQTIIERTLNEAGIDDLSVLKLSVSEIKALTVAQKYNGEFYDELTKKQIKLLIKIKEEGLKIRFVAPEYYLSIQGIKDKRTVSERSNEEDFKKSKVVFASVASKLLLTISFSIILALFIRDVTSGDYTAAEVATKLFARLFAFFTSVFMGYLVGCQINDIDAEYIEMRSGVHIDFLEDKEFKEKDVKEIAKEHFIDRVKKEQVLKLDNKQSQIEMKGA
jgi:hypothetical protein